MRFWKPLLLLLASSLCLAAQPDRIAGPINSSQTVPLARSVHPRALPQYDQGPVEPSFSLSYISLLIAPSASQQMAIDQLLAQQQDRSSPNFHKWLTPEQYADRFGLSQNDVNKVTVWLQSQGFTILYVARARNFVNFSGTAAQIQGAFKTEIHRYEINGKNHIANSTPVLLPAALGGLVSGVRGLNNFLPKPRLVRPVPGSASAHGPHPHYTTTIQGNTDYFVAPGDIATIYDIDPLYNATSPINGAGEKLAIVGQTDIYMADINNFRSGFGLPAISGCATNASGLVTSCNSTYFQYVLPTGTTDLGTTYLCNDVPEADLDIEWSGATARNAQIIFVNSPVSYDANCNYTNNNGVNASLQFAIDNKLAPVISMSYGSCEFDAGSLESELSTASTEGITVMNSAGDTGAAACDYGPPGNPVNPPFAPAVGGLEVSYPASSVYVTGVGGTSIPAFPTNDYTSAFWAPSNAADGGSALPALQGQEVSWDDDEAFALFCQGDPSNSFCEAGGSPAVPHWVPLTSSATAAQVQEDIWIAMGGGGVSNCINESASDVCESGFARPSWQSAITIPGLTSPQDTYRMVPDVSLLASPNFPGYIYCTPMNQLSGSGTNTASSCASGIATAVDTNFSLVGGTSASTPVFAGIVTLLNQYLGGSGLGPINQTLYTLAATPSNGAFHSIENGVNQVTCQENTPAGQPADVICPSTGATPGVFGFDAANFDTTTGYNLVTGLGSVDANKLAQAWAATLAPDFQFLTPAALSPSPVPAGQQTATTLTIAPISGSTGMVVNFAPSSCSGLPAGATCSFNPASVTFDGTDPATTVITITTTANMALPTTGAQTITITPTNSINTKTTVSLTVAATNQSFTLSTSAATFSVPVGAKATVPITVANGTATNSPIPFVGTSTTALPISYSCAGISASAEISCQLPNNGQPSNATAVSVFLVTTAPTTSRQRPLGRGSRVFYAMLLPGVLGIMFAGGARRRGLQLFGLVVILALSTLWMSACGGSSSSQNNPGTPAGSYKVTINATTGGTNPLISSLTVTLNVQ